MDKQKIKSLLASTDLTIKEAMYKLTETAEKILFIVSDNLQLLGTVTDGDIRMGIMHGSEFNDKIISIMQREYTSFKEGISEADIKKYSKKIMTEKKIEHIPILDDDGVIVDVISWTDVLKEPNYKDQIEFNSTPVVIMAGGQGTRLDPFTKILPKPLIPVGSKPIIEHIMEGFYKYGYQNFIYTLNYKKEYIKLFLKENVFPYEISWIEEHDNDYLGTAGSIAFLKDEIKEPFFVTNCDILMYEANYNHIFNWHKEHQASITVIGTHEEVKIQYGVLQVSGGKLSGMLEKPVHDVLINTGIYVIEPHVISYIKKGQKMDMNELINKVAEKEKVTVYPMYGGWLDVGQWEGYHKTVEHLKAI